MKDKQMHETKKENPLLGSAIGKGNKHRSRAGLQCRGQTPRAQMPAVAGASLKRGDTDAELGQFGGS